MCFYTFFIPPGSFNGGGRHWGPPLNRDFFSSGPKNPAPLKLVFWFFPFGVFFFWPFNGPHKTRGLVGGEIFPGISQRVPQFVVGGFNLLTEGNIFLGEIFFLNLLMFFFLKIGSGTR